VSFQWRPLIVRVQKETVRVCDVCGVGDVRAGAYVCIIKDLIDNNNNNDINTK